MLTAIIDYGSGNLHSAEKAFQRMAREVGAGDVVVTADPERVRAADRIVLPGIHEALEEAVQGAGRPFLGICIGMQMLATRGLEYEPTPGLDWIGGEVVRIAPDDPALKVPHMGWNDLAFDTAHPVFDGVASGAHAYFVHSYHFQTADPAHRLAHVDYGGEITAMVGRDNILGMQFHPEKSQQTGLRLIANFLKWTP